MTETKYLHSYISKHTELSGNQIYEHFKGTKYGIRKTSFYDLYRNIRRLPEPTYHKRIISTRKGYRKPVRRKIKRVKILKPTYQVEIIEPKRRPKYYNATKYIDDRNQKPYWVKWKDEQALESCLNALSMAYNGIPRKHLIPVGITTRHKYDTKPFVERG